MDSFFSFQDEIGTILVITAIEDSSGNFLGDIISEISSGEDFENVSYEDMKQAEQGILKDGKIFEENEDAPLKMPDGYSGDDSLATTPNSALPFGLHRRSKQAQDELWLDLIALDADPSNRTYSQDGHLHVKENVVSAAQVNDYRAEEIPNWQELGLQSGRVYALLRDPVELEKSLATPQTSIHGKPVVIIHKSQTADAHDKEITVGSVMNPRWEYPNLIAEISIWEGDAIKAIENGEQADLSSGYHYDPVIESGEFNGTKYDIVMRNISFNHLCLVKIGRVIGAMVGDSEDDPWRVIERAILGLDP